MFSSPSVTGGATPPTQRAAPDSASTTSAGTPVPAGPPPVRDYLLTRLYEENGTVHPLDQDTLGPLFGPLKRHYTDRNAGLDLGRMHRIQPPTNSRRLGVFLDPATGIHYHVKKFSEPEKAHHEVLFGNLARRFGVNVPRTQVLEHDGQTYLASAIVDRLKLANELFPNCAIDARVLASIPRACPEVGAAFVAAALLNNLDIVGLGCDNLGFVDLPDGRLLPVFLDFGGSGIYRATRGKKSFGPQAQEFDMMTRPQLQADDFGGGPNGLIFAMTPPAMLRESMDRILAVPDGDIRAEIDRHVPDEAMRQQLFDTILRRRDAIQARLADGKPSLFRRKVDDLVKLGITNAYGWDDEQPDITEALLTWLEPGLDDFIRDDLDLMADSDGQLQLADKIRKKVEPLLGELMALKYPGQPRAEPPFRKKKKADTDSQPDPLAQPSVAAMEPDAASAAP